MTSEHLEANRKNIHEKVIERINTCIKDARKKYTQDFFVIVQYLPKKKSEKKGVQINVAALDTIPTPTYNTDMFKYHYLDDKLDLLWSLPSMQDSLDMFHNKDLIEPSEWPLLKHVIDYFDGTIFKMIAEWENSDGAIAREREHASRDIGTPKSSIFG